MKRTLSAWTVALVYACIACLLTQLIIFYRRYVYQDVLRLIDAEKLIDCSFVQPYITNSAKVLFLKPRPKGRKKKRLGKFCIACERSLQDPYVFCSIFCKVMNYIVSNDKLSRKQFSYKYDWLVGLQVEGGQLMTPPTSVLQTVVDIPLATSSSGGSSGSNVPTNYCEIKNTNHQSLQRKCSRSSSTNLMFEWPSECAVSATKRRKNAPQRSPLS